MNRKTLIIAGAIVIILIILIIITTTVRNRPVNFTVISEPNNIEIYVDNQRYETPLSIKIKPGSYTIWGLKEGYAPYKESFQIKKGQDNQLNIKLEQEQEPPEGAPD